MPQVIIFETVERGSSVRTLVENLQKAGVHDAILIAKQLTKGTVAKENFVSCSRGAVSKAFERALGKSKQKKLLLLNSECGFADRQLKSALQDADKLDADKVGYVPLKVDKAVIDFSEKKPASLVTFLASNKPLPAMCVASGTEMARKVAGLGADSAIEVSAQLLLLAVASSQGAVRLGEPVKISPDRVAASPLQLTGPECARCLRAVVEAFNIEDLFPAHPWGKFQEESLAASYHTLAALFLRLADYDSAEEVLVQADQLEDSPRSLALKGIICARKGDWLNSAANLIASLQQYESRMRSIEEHYVKFGPKDFQKINSVLLFGLDALNHRNNQAAVRHFADAIFLYDAFYRENGVATLKVIS